MRKNKKLFVAWSVFGLCLILFLGLTRFYFGAANDRSVVYQYRIVANIADAREKGVSDDVKPAVIAIEERKKTAEWADICAKLQHELYEKTSFGFLPRISPDGVRVLDTYSAKFMDEKKERLYLVVLLNDDMSPNALSNIVKKIQKGKITFIVPQYSKNFTDIVNIIISSGNEFFLQLPTQMSIPKEKQGVVSPFFANMDPAALFDQLQRLLASTKYAIGVANTTSTLLTKSAKDMTIITDELSKRGVAFLDLEQGNEILQKIADSNAELVYIKGAALISEQVRTEYLRQKNIVTISADDLPMFLAEFSKQKAYVLAPITAMVKR